MSRNQLTFTSEDPIGVTAQSLIGDLCSEMLARYGRPPSPFSTSEACVPRSIFIVARINDQAVGCGALRPLDDTTAEIKRMYVAPAARRCGIARRILTELETRAIAFHYGAIRLETGIRQPEAQALYASLGYKTIPPFGPYTATGFSVCYEKILSPPLSQIYNFRSLGPRLGTSGQPTAAQFQLISDAGFEVVINLALPTSDNALPSEGSLVTALGMSYVHIPVNFQAPSELDFRAFSRVMDAFADRPVFVHCAANMRVSAFLFLYRVLRRQVPVSEAEGDLHAIWQPDEVWSRFIEEQLTLTPPIPSAPAPS
jgi:protein tyrosine phosphatase (PTP) superfamily phosphohydrolase (DUF442 family)/ribosomal protein S18 acetylase RimI-like enzyme